MAFVTIEDQTGQGEVVLFPSLIERTSHLLKIDEPVMVKGAIELRGGAIKIKGNTLDPMWKVRDQYVDRVLLQLDVDSLQPESIDQIHELCLENPGQIPLHFEVNAAGLPKPIRLRSRDKRIELTPDLINGLSRIITRERIILEGGN